jgi:SNF2 family DNA or RNA helicase
MGLGKTIQAIAFIAEMIYTYKISRPYLISVPLSTITNWKREFETWLPEVNVLTYLGKGKSRKFARDLLFFHEVKTGKD